MRSMLRFCRVCRHLRAIEPTRIVCEAFPGGLYGIRHTLGADHRYRIPGDGGIRFEAADDVSGETLRELAARD